MDTCPAGSRCDLKAYIFPRMFREKIFTERTRPSGAEPVQISEENRNYPMLGDGAKNSLSSVCQSCAAYLYRKTLARKTLATGHASGESKIVRSGRSYQRKRIVVDRAKYRLRAGIVLRNGNLSSHLFTFNLVCSAVDKSIIASVDRSIFQHSKTWCADPSPRAKVNSIDAVLHSEFVIHA